MRNASRERRKERGSRKKDAKPRAPCSGAPVSLASDVATELEEESTDQNVCGVKHE